MNPHYDVIIVGAGLAGASAALWLSHRFRVLIVEADEPAAGASGAGAGLINPLLGQRARPVWRVDDALEIVEETIERADASDLFDDRGLIRPALDEEQARRFEAAADDHPALAVWFPADRMQAEFPDVSARHGALRIVRGGAIDITRFVGRMIKTAASAGAEARFGTAVTGWTSSASLVEVSLSVENDVDVITARHLVLATGDGFLGFPALRRLALHRIKGQTIRIRRPSGIAMPCAIPPISGSGYIVPEVATWVLGSTYEHRFTSTTPTLDADRAIIDKTSAMIPSIRDAEILDRRAGVRVTVPRLRLPMVGPVDGERVWTINGLGSKGLLLAPFIAKSLCGWIADPTLVPPELGVRESE
jgi:glycine/D-amino acid oxidase-like deaminating enzyme